MNEKRRDYVRAWKAANKARVTASRKAWEAKNPEKLAEYRRRHPWKPHPRPNHYIPSSLVSPEVLATRRARSKAYYHAHKDDVLSRLAEERAALTSDEWKQRRAASRAAYHRNIDRERERGRAKYWRRKESGR